MVRSPPSARLQQSPETDCGRVSPSQGRRLDNTGLCLSCSDLLARRVEACRWGSSSFGLHVRRADMWRGGDLQASWSARQVLGLLG